MLMNSVCKCLKETYKEKAFKNINQGDLDIDSEEERKNLKKLMKTIRIY